MNEDDLGRNKIDSDNSFENFSSQLDRNIKNIVHKEGYVTYDIKTRNLSRDIGGYTGTVLAIDVIGKTKDGYKETNIFVKKLVPVETPIYDVKKIYNREMFMYTEIFKKMYDLQEKEHVPINDRLKIANAFEECNDEEIILENLTMKGFKIFPKQEILELKHAELIVKYLAKLHSLSLAIEVKEPDYFDIKVKTMDCVYNFNDYFHKFSHSIRKYVTQFLTDDVRERVGHRLEEIVDKYPSYMNDASCQVKTICHGDFRHSNILVKEIDGKPTEVIAVDYQITFYGNPVLDFIYFIFWGTDQEFREKHMEHLKQLYYHSLTKFLGYLTIEVEKVFPKEEFEKQYNDKLDFGLMISVFYLPYLFPLDEIGSTEDELLNESPIKVDSKYVERFTGIVDDYIKWGYL